MKHFHEMLTKLRSLGISALEITGVLSQREQVGLGVLVKDSILTYYSLDILDRQHEDILRVLFTGTFNLQQVFNVCSCYLPPADISRGDKSHEFFDVL